MNPWNLTARESDVMDALIESGGCNKTIAKKLGIAAGTVENHTVRIYERMAVHTRTKAAVVWALWRAGLPPISMCGEQVSRV
jgi:two-component system nitrate/nitrite response regulator NarL